MERKGLTPRRIRGHFIGKNGREQSCSTNVSTVRENQKSVKRINAPVQQTIKQTRARAMFLNSLSHQLGNVSKDTEIGSRSSLVNTTVERLSRGLVSHICTRCGPIY